jgi:hypothetical protein
MEAAEGALLSHDTSFIDHEKADALFCDTSVLSLACWKKYSHPSDIAPKPHHIM